MSKLMAYLRTFGLDLKKHLRSSNRRLDTFEKFRPPQSRAVVRQPIASKQLRFAGVATKKPRRRTSARR
ncbi:hypothetical protein WJX82_010115 [Trebouxia sp. C0006]